jgi:hypothetical protein
MTVCLSFSSVSNDRALERKTNNFLVVKRPYAYARAENEHFYRVGFLVVLFGMRSHDGVSLLFLWRVKRPYILVRSS